MHWSIPVPACRGGSVTVCLDAAPNGALSIWVQDDGAEIAAAGRPTTGLPGVAESGYGLGIVAAVAASWGNIPATDGRSVTWCVILAGGDQ